MTFAHEKKDLVTKIQVAIEFNVGFIHEITPRKNNIDQNMK